MRQMLLIIYEFRYNILSKQLWIHEAKAKWIYRVR